MPLRNLAWGSSLAGGLEQLRGRSVLIATRDQLTAGLAFIELDGIARRLILCPADLPRELLPSVIAIAEVDAIVSNEAAPDGKTSGIRCFVTYSPKLTRGDYDRRESHQTEWI